MNETKQVVAGRYQLVREIARGGMGSVHEAVHLVSKKRVAVKLLFSHVTQDDAARQRFLREASAPAQIGHEGIVEVYDAGVDDDGCLFVAMELLEGKTLRDRLDAGGLQLPELLSIFLRMLDPLAAAHAKGIVHRDLKPENVFLVRKPNGTEVLKILDFGIARDLAATQQSMTQTGTAMGTPHYMAPEQAMSARGVVASADVWAVGAMLYESLTGRVPFDGETASAVIVHVCTQPHRPPLELAPGIPLPLAQLVDRCLSKKPEERPQHGGELLHLLTGVAAQLGISTAQAHLSGTPSMPGPAPGAYASVPGMPGHASAGPMPGYAGAPGSSAGMPGYATGGGAPGYGAPPPQGYGGAPGSSPNMPGYATGGAAPGFGGAPGYGAPTGSSPGMPGYATGAPAPGFGAAPGSSPGMPGYATPTPGPGFGTPSAVGAGNFPTMPASQGFPAAPPIEGSGKKKGLLIGAGLGVLALCGVCGVFAALGGDDAQTTALPPTAAAGTVPSVPGAVPPVPTPAAATVQRLNGSLAAGDNTLSSGEFADAYTFPFTAGQRFRARAHSDKLDPYLIVRTVAGKSQDNDDVQPGVLDAQIEMVADGTGSFTVIVTSARPGETGDYELTVETLP